MMSIEYPGESQGKEWWLHSSALEKVHLCRLRCIILLVLLGDMLEVIPESLRRNNQRSKICCRKQHRDAI